MKPTMLLVFACFLCAAQRVFAKPAVVGDSLTFTVDDKTCPGETACALNKVSAASGAARAVTVATRVDRFWKGVPGYQERVKHVSPTEFKLEDFKMTDGGSYKLIGEDQKTLIQLTGLVPYHLSVTEGGTATLQSHYDTDGKDLQLTGWERDGQSVCQARTGDSPTTTGAPCVPQDWPNTGNMSLVLPRVRTDQQGLYLNYVRDGHGRTDVTAVKLTVHERSPAPVPPVPTPPPNEKTCIIWIVVLAVLAVLAAAGWGWALWQRFYRPPGPGAAVQQPNGDIEPGLLRDREPHSSSLM